MNLIICVKKSIDYKKFVTKGCHINIQKISSKTDMFCIMKYIHKDFRLHMIPYEQL